MFFDKILEAVTKVVKQTAKKIFLFFLLPVTIFSQTFWQTTNGPQGSASSAIAVSSEGRIFINLDNNSNILLYSDDKGITWNETAPFNSNHVAYRIELTSEDYLFTGAFFGGVFRSTNLGEDWEKLNNYGSRVLKISPKGDIWIADYWVYVSNDNGDTWNIVNGPFWDVYNITFDSEGAIYITDGSLYKSIDGKDWTSLNLDRTGVSRILITSAGTILAARGYYDINLFRSVDGGATWDSLKAGGGVYPTSFIEDFEGNIYLGKNAGGVVRSTDDGISWSQFDEGLLNDRIWDFAVDPEGDVYCVSDEFGVYRLGNDNSWQIVSPNATNIRQIATDESDNVFALVSGIGRLFHSSDNGETWSSPYDSPEYNYSYEMFVLSSDGTLFAATDNQILKSEDFGFTWKTVFENDDSFYGIRHLAISPNDNLYAVRGKELIRSTDLGENWDPIGKEAPDFVNELNINSFETIFVGTSDGLFYSYNSGMDWTEAEELTRENISGICSFRSLIFATGKFNLFFSSDNGQSWIKNNKGINGKYATNMTFSNDGKFIYAITNDRSFYWTSDYGESWTELNDGLAEYNTFTTLSVNNNDEIFVGTTGGGVYKSSGPVTAVESDGNELPSEFTLKQNYPNPFGKSSVSGSGFTTIEFTIPNSFPIVQSQLSVYDALGREIAKLVDENKSPGTYKVDFDASKLASGVYFYTLKAGSKAITKKMLILR